LKPRREDQPQGGPETAHRTLEAFTAASGDVEGVSLRSLEPGSVVLVDTRNSLYRLVVLDGPDQRVLVRGGSVFSERTEARVEGSSAGGSSIRTGWIGVGLRLELTVDTSRIITSPIKGVTIESVPPAAARGSRRPTA
jgi:hypothetical protein